MDRDDDPFFIYIFLGHEVGLSCHGARQREETRAARSSGRPRRRRERRAASGLVAPFICTPRCDDAHARTGHRRPPAERVCRVACNHASGRATMHGREQLGLDCFRRIAPEIVPANQSLYKLEKQSGQKSFRPTNPIETNKSLISCRRRKGIGSVPPPPRSIGISSLARGAFPVPARRCMDMHTHDLTAHPQQPYRAPSIYASIRVV
jgi:hypothetical protein